MLVVFDPPNAPNPPKCRIHGCFSGRVGRTGPPNWAARKASKCFCRKRLGGLGLLGGLKITRIVPRAEAFISIRECVASPIKAVRPRGPRSVAWDTGIDACRVQVKIGTIALRRRAAA